MKLRWPVAVLFSDWPLIAQLAKREIAVRYRGSIGGTLWALVNPLLLLALYAFVFSTIFKMKWGAQSESKLQFAIAVFAGLIVHGLFAECVARAPGIVLANANFVKKVVFPLEVLPWVTVLAALFQAGVNLLVLTAFVAFDAHGLGGAVVFLPLVMLPLVLFTVGTCWFLAALGVFLRDIGQTVGFATTLLLFLSPVFYPLGAVPPDFRLLVEWNFLTPIIESLRAVMILGRAPDWGLWLALAVLSYLVAGAGLYWFQRSRPGFADVV
jgi:lipopolysaccharide transport system permease protein